MYNQTRIVLQPNVKVSVRTSTFEEAFGEHSNAGGFAKKRAARVEARQVAKRQIKSARAETKVAKQQNKGAVKAARVEKRAVKQQAEIAKRGDAQAARGGNKIARLANRTQAKQMRVDKRQISAPPEIEQEEQFEEELQEETPIEEGQEEEVEEPTDETETSEEDDGSEPADESYEEEYFDDIHETESSFEGQNEMLLEPNLTYRYTDANGDVVKALIDENVFDCAKKIQWNKEAVCRLENGLLNCKDENSAQKFRGDISRHKNRALQLEGELSNYCSADGGEDSLAIGMRVSEAAAAEREAKKARMRVRKDSAKTRSMKRDPRTFTEIEQGLDPRTTEGMIKIPAREIAADGTESNDNPSETVFEDVDSCADGSDSNFDAKSALKKVSWIGVGAGVLVAASVIYLVSKNSKA